MAVFLGVVAGDLTFGPWRHDSGRELVLTLLSIAVLTALVNVPNIVMEGGAAVGLSGLAPYLALFLSPVPAMLVRRRGHPAAEEGGRV